MERAVRRWAATLITPVDEVNLAPLVKKLSKTYTVYGCMILLPPNSIDNEAFQTIFNSEAGTAETNLYKSIAREMKITHIAINQPIPLSKHASPDLERDLNTIRAPVNFKPIYGDFGPSHCTVPADEADFERAFWVVAKQNGIAQTWAPLWTMFSRGNISEKARLLDLPAVQEAIADAASDGRGCTVVDLYAGIGYFTFSYLKADFEKALCWELNEWSCEGLRRGARANGWSSTTYDALAEAEDLTSSSERVLIFNETNELALLRLQILRSSLSPIRHVNCGLLPTSKPSWAIAFECLDKKYDGWVHLHENFAVDEIEARAEDVRQHFQNLLDLSGGIHRVVLEHIHRVKTYAPGVWHCVLDVRIPASAAAPAT